MMPYRTWHDTKGTLDDEAIFGPLMDHKCSCGKLAGSDREGQICDICGVKIATREVRRRRFGHINLLQPTSQPWSQAPVSIDPFPVLPAVIRESSAGLTLNGLYEMVLSGAVEREPRLMLDGLRALFDRLLPVLAVASDWSLEDARLIANGLALVPR